VKIVVVEFRRDHGGSLRPVAARRPHGLRTGSLSPKVQAWSDRAARLLDRNVVGRCMVQEARDLFPEVVVRATHRNEALYLHVLEDKLPEPVANERKEVG